MNKSCILLLLLLIHAAVSNHLQGGGNPAFNNWANTPAGVRPGTPPAQNPAFANWANRPGAPNPQNPQNPAFSNWANRPGTPNPGVPQNPAFTNWANRPGTPPPQNPAFANWANRPATGPQNPAFNNWANQGVRPGTAPVGGISSGRAGFSNWLNRPGVNPGLNPGIGGSLVRPGVNPGLNNNWITSSLAGSLDLDHRIRTFLAQNRINAAVPDANACMRYSVPNSASRYQVSCALPSGQRFTQVCQGPANCNLVTCKLSFCSRIPGARLLRTPF